MSKAKVTIATHSGNFHADELFAVATLGLVLEAQGQEFEVVRTRDMSEIEGADYAVDVGLIHDPEKLRFDHHQEGRAGRRENGIFYSSFGLVWNTYGESVCGSGEVADRIDKKLVQAIDAIDNGQEVSKALIKGVYMYTFADSLDSYKPTWLDDDQDFTHAFMSALSWTRAVLEREIVHAKADLEAEKKVEDDIKAAKDERLLVRKNHYPIDEEVLARHPKLLFIVTQNDKDRWTLKTIKVSRDSFKTRKDLPKSWAGKSGKELQDVTGVPDATFAHNGRFIAGAKSEEGALALAKLALET